MKHLKKFEAFYDNEVLKFMYQLEDLDKELSARSYEGWGMWVNYTFDENVDFILVEIGASGYSDGFHRDMKIYYKEHMVGPIKVEEWESSFSPYGEGNSNDVKEYDSYEDIIEEIKSHFGL
jgi:hypothetical protein